MQVVFLNHRVEKIKNNPLEIDRFVEEYKPFIASCTEKAVGRYVRYGEDDELSIALMAFVEAINSFDSGKGNFLGFAQSVIKRRIIDYYRKEKNHLNVISIDDYTQGKEDMDFSINESMDRYSMEETSEYRRMEIEDLKKELGEWDISFFELAEVSPKQLKTKKLCNEIIGYILRNDELLNIIKMKKYLPIAEIETALKVPRKKIERSRKYIIAAIIIMTGDYEYIKDYISWGVN